MLDNTLLRQLRQARLMSQQDLANDHIPLSLTTIKRAEAGRAVRFRIAREFSRCFDVLVTRIVRAEGFGSGVQPLTRTEVALEAI